jgi:potassium large conductance calcium-activated channel subfamily M alpha protein 1
MMMTILVHLDLLGFFSLWVLDFGLMASFVSLDAEKVVILADHGQPVDLSGDGVEGGRTGGKTASAYSSDVDNIVIAANVDRLVGEKKEIMVVEMQQTIGFYYLRPQFAVHRNQVNKSDYKRNRDALLYFGPPYMEGKAVSQMLLGYLL